METHKATWSLTPLHDFSFHGDNKIGLWFERVWWYCNTICAWCFWHIFLHAIIPLPTTCGLWNNTTWCVILYNQNSDESQENRWDSWFSSPSQAFCFDFHMSIVTNFKDLFSNGFLAEQILQSNRQSSFPFGTSNQNGHIKISKDELFCGVRNKIKKQKSFSLIFSRNAKERFACGGNKTISTHRMVPSSYLTGRKNDRMEGNAHTTDQCCLKLEARRNRKNCSIYPRTSHSSIHQLSWGGECRAWIHIIPEMDIIAI